MKLEYAGVAKENIKAGINIDSISDVKRTKIIKNVMDRKVSDMLDWLDLPNQSQKELDRIIEFGRNVRKHYDNFIVLGIGGSALGVKMLKNTFVDSIHKDIGIRVEVCDNIDPDSFLTLLDGINLKKTMFNVITKSGSTSETLAQMSLVISKYIDKRIPFNKHFVITTSKDNSLYKFAQNNNIEIFEIPFGAGGRFSVLSTVGLVPASVMGVDITKLLKGANVSKKNSSLNSNSNLAYTSAYINYTYLSMGKTNLVMMPYSDRLGLVPDFFAQLWAESLGKKYNRKGEIVYAGQTPIKTIGVTDQHSQLQLYSEGPEDKLFIFVSVESSDYDRNISYEIPFAKHLNNTTLKTLLDYEYMSTAYSLTTLNRPNYTINLDKVNEESMGEFIFFMEMMTAYMGEMMEINTYDQPGVELSKVYTKACLNMKGFEEKSKEIKDYKKSSKKYTI